MGKRLKAMTGQTEQEPRESFSHARSGLGLWRVAGSCGRSLSRECVHGSQELICDASSLPESTEEGTVDCGGVISDGVLPGEEKARHGLKGKEEKTLISLTLLTGN